MKTETLDPAAFHGLAGELVESVAPHTEADPAALLLDFLACFGSAVGPGPHVRVGGAVHPARLFVLLVGTTSRARKGKSRAELRPVFAVADPGWSSERVVGGLSSGEGLIAAVRDGANGDDPGVADKRLLAVEEEFESVLKVASRDGNTLSEVLRRAWDTGNIRTLTRKDPLRSTGAHISVLAHVTAEELRHRLTELETANGFANRFLIAQVARARLLPHGGRHLCSHNSLYSQVRGALETARRIGEVRRSGHADELWELVYEYLETRDDRGLIGALTARSSAHVLRLSLVYALCDGSRTIESAHIEAAYAVWRHCDASVRALFKTSTGNGTADRIAEELVKAGAYGLDRTTIGDLFSRHASKPELDDALTLLVDLGEAVVVRQPTGGRPTLRYFASEKSERSEITLAALDDLTH